MLVCAMGSERETRHQDTQSQRNRFPNDFDPSDLTWGVAWEGAAAAGLPFRHCHPYMTANSLKNKKSVRKRTFAECDANARGAADVESPQSRSGCYCCPPLHVKISEKGVAPFHLLLLLLLLRFRLPPRPARRFSLISPSPPVRTKTPCCATSRTNSVPGDTRPRLLLSSGVSDSFSSRCVALRSFQRSTF